MLIVYCGKGERVMYSVYKQDVNDWFIAKLNLIKQVDADIIVAKKASEKVDLKIYREQYVKEVFDRLMQEANIGTLDNFMIADLQRITKYRYPVVSGIIDLFLQEGIFERKDDNFLFINEDKFNYFKEAIIHELKFKTIGDGSDKEIIQIEIIHHWHDHGYAAPYKKNFYGEKHQFYEINNILKIPDDKLKYVKTFDSQIAFEIKIALRFGIVYCGDKDVAIMLDSKLRELGEDSDFLSRASF